MYMNVYVYVMYHKHIYLCRSIEVRQCWNPSFAAKLGTAQDDSVINSSWNIQIRAIGFTQLKHQGRRKRDKKSHYTHALLHIMNGT